jgi:hypothetical protein
MTQQSGLIKDAIFSFCLRCADCGRLLKIKAGSQLSKEAAEADYRTGSGDSVTFVEPCHHCVEKATAPALALKSALATLMEAQQ